MASLPATTSTTDAILTIFTEYAAHDPRGAAKVILVGGVGLLLWHALSDEGARKNLPAY